MREKTDTLPKATAKRLPLYLRYLKMLDDSGISRIKSNEFSEITQIPSATIRRDFSQLGELGRSGYGYDVPFLIDVFNNILNTKEEKRIALVGYGNLGKALKHNNFRRNENLNIVCVFDNDPALAEATRKAVIEQVLRDKTLVAGMHFGASAFGYIEGDAHSGYLLQPKTD